MAGALERRPRPSRAPPAAVQPPGVDLPVQEKCREVCQLCAVRSAMIRQSDRSGAGRAGARADAGAGRGCECCTSAAVTAPPGPDPLNALMSTPSSAAIRRALGDASCRRPPWPAAAAWGCRTRSPRRRPGHGRPPGRPAHVTLGGANLGQGAVTRRLDLTVALSVSTSISGSPAALRRPRTSASKTVPVSCAMPRAGMITSPAISGLPRARPPSPRSSPASAP